ncbi:Protein rrf1 [Xylographa soralifera]|nr:Protein rrf1 [Xylographa soralifera]
MWPHFMEKRHKPKDQIYVSKKVLGQLYDLVERVDFIPELEAPFDARILGAYNLDPQILLEAAEIKAVYDAAMHRIMAQHEIRTEHEVWSTFVLQHANQSKDFKFHEEMGAISASLKDRFRAACYEKAGGTEFAKIGPFVAAMYRVTSDELTHALDECRQTRNIGAKDIKVRQRLAMNMPLMSFPWLFGGILGKIANRELTASQGTIVDFASNTSGQPKKPGAKRKSEEVTLDGEGDTLRTTEGLVHRGELLRLFVDADQQHEAASKIMVEVSASSSSSGYYHNKIGEAEYPPEDGMKTPKVEPPCLKSTPQLEKADDITQQHKEFISDDEGNEKVESSSVAADSPTLRTLIDFGVDDKVDKELNLAPQVQSNSIGNIGSKFIGSLLDFEFSNDRKEFESKSLSAVQSPQDLLRTPAFDLLSLEDVVDQPAAHPQYTLGIGSDTQIESPLVVGDSNEGAIALTEESERTQLEDLLMKHDCDISDANVLVVDGDGTNLRDMRYRDHDAGGLEVTGNVDIMRALKDEGTVEEKVVLNLDDKPSLLERLAFLNAE